MKYLKLFEDFGFEDINKICRKYNIVNYVVDTDGNIDTDSYVYCYKNQLTSFEFVLY